MGHPEPGGTQQRWTLGQPPRGGWGWPHVPPRCPAGCSSGCGEPQGSSAGGATQSPTVSPSSDSLDWAGTSTTGPAEGRGSAPSGLGAGTPNPGRALARPQAQPRHPPARASRKEPLSRESRLEESLPAESRVMAEGERSGPPKLSEVRPGERGARPGRGAQGGRGDTPGRGHAPQAGAVPMGECPTARGRGLCPCWGVSVPGG